MFENRLYADLMPEKKKFLLRISPELWASLEAWAQAEFRSVNGQIEYLLRTPAGMSTNVTVPSTLTPVFPTASRTAIVSRTASSGRAVVGRVR